MNLDNQSYLNQLCESHILFFNISKIYQNNQESNKKVTMQCPLNQFSETDVAVRGILLSQWTCLAQTRGFLLVLKILNHNKSLSISISIFALLIYFELYTLFFWVFLNSLLFEYLRTHFLFMEMSNSHMSVKRNFHGSYASNSVF